MNTLFTYAKFFSLGVLFMALTTTHKVYAEAKVSATSAAFVQVNLIASVKPVDNRVQILHDYLVRQNSPLADSAKTFISQADKYNLDWKLVAAISGLESGFGKQIPPYSYNGWGWGVYGTNVKYFRSWDDAITQISEGLRENYINKMGTDNVYAIGHTYAASPTWAVRVEHFMYDIDRYSAQWSPQTLSVSL